MISERIPMLLSFDSQVKFVRYGAAPAWIFALPSVLQPCDSELSTISDSRYRRDADTAQNQKSYERTDQTIENKGKPFSEPTKLLIKQDLALYPTKLRKTKDEAEKVRKAERGSRRCQAHFSCFEALESRFFQKRTNEPIMLWKTMALCQILSSGDAPKKLSQGCWRQFR